MQVKRSSFNALKASVVILTWEFSSSSATTRLRFNALKASVVILTPVYKVNLIWVTRFNALKASVVILTSYRVSLATPEGSCFNALKASVVILTVSLDYEGSIYEHVSMP